MTGNDQLNREKEIFQQALEYCVASEREAFLTVSCGDDQGLYSRVNCLLRSHASSRFLPDAPSSSVSARSILGEQPGDRIGQYKLVRVLGEGGCGVVYVAEQESPVRRQVALKVIKPGMDTKSVLARFDAERQALAMMDHPHIAKVLEGGVTASGRPFFVMELVDGLPITEFCNRHSLSVPKRLELFVQVCQAVQHAHQKGVIHRDLKPSNILVVHLDGVPIPKVIDFGIAKALEGRLSNFTVQTEMRHLLGTPAYMPPEQAEAGPIDIDTRADIYSLGIVLFDLLTGTTPFDSKKLSGLAIEEVQRVLRDVEPPSPSSGFSQLAPESQKMVAGERGTHPAGLERQLRGDLDSITLKCLEKDRSRRYDTANALGMDIKRHLREEPVLATPPSAVYRVLKFVRRNRAAVVTVAAAILLLISATIGTSIGFLRAERTAGELERNLYINRIALAHRELTSDPPNIREAERLLDSCPRKLRGWEWHYLKRQWLDAPRIVEDPSGRGFSSVALAHDGSVIATAGHDGYVRIWDSGTRRLLQSLPAHTNGFAVSVMFDPRNGDQLISAGSDQLIKMWDWRSVRILHSWPLHFSFEWGMAYSVAFSPDGERVAGSTAFDTIKIWSAGSGKELISFSGHQAAAFSLAFSRDGSDLAVGCSDGLVRIWNTTTGEQVQQSFGQKSDPVACVAYSADGQKIGAASFNGTVRVWERSSGKELLNFQAHTTHAVALSFHPDGTRIATGGHDCLLKLWDAKSGERLLAIPDFSKAVRCVQFNSDGSQLLATSTDGTVREFNATPRGGTEGEGLLTATLPGTVLGGVEARSDGSQFFAAGGATPSVRNFIPLYFWNTATGQRNEILTDYSGFVFSVSLSSDERFLATSGDDTGSAQEFAIKIWDLQTRKLALITDGVPGRGVLFSVAYSPDGKYLVAGGHQGKIIAWDTATGRLRGILGEHVGGRTIFHLAFSSNGKFLASTTQDGNVRVWDATGSEQSPGYIAEFQAATPDYTDSLAFSPECSRLVTAQDDYTAAIYDIASKRSVLLLKSERKHGFRAVAYSPDGEWIASGGTDATVRLWNAATGELVRTFAGHQCDVMRLRFTRSPDGLRVISASRDCTLKVWEVPKSQLQ